MSESGVLSEIEAAAVHHRICVLPRNPKKLSCSVWSMPDTRYHVGVIWRRNTGALKQGNRFIRFGMPGDSDFTGWLFAVSAEGRREGARLIELEAKQPGKALSPNQEAKRALAQATGVLWGRASSYDEACALFKFWGLKSI